MPLKKLKWWFESIVDRWAVAWLDRYATPVELAGPSFYEGFKGVTGPPRTIDVSTLDLSTIVFRDNKIDGQNYAP